MRLLNTKTLALKEFPVDEIPRYAILSHRWGEDEVTFQDIQDLIQAKQKTAFAKIVGFCRCAASFGIEYGWIDTCCIDRRSSTELQEAIGSMYQWYKCAAVCIAYLKDVYEVGNDFVGSQWFTRGWTLQELLAPLRLEFYNADWLRLGSKLELLKHVEKATGIAESAIIGLKTNDYCVAEKMSWAAGRVTTRPEDVAYSLQGLFDVHIPLLFGEGEGAFLRLQRAILEKTDDRSIIAWSGIDSRYARVLAKSPAYFKSSNFSSRDFSSRLRYLSPHSLDAHGLLIEMYLWPVGYKTYLAAINVPQEGGMFAQSCCFFLRWAGEAQYIRVNHEGGGPICGSSSSVSEFVSLSANGRLVRRPSFRRRITIRQNIDLRTLSDIVYHTPQQTPDFCIEMPQRLRLINVYTPGQWDQHNHTLKLKEDHLGTGGVFVVEYPTLYDVLSTDYPKIVLLGFDFDFFPVCVIASFKGLKEIRKHHTSANLNKATDDIMRARIEDITCFERYGWSIISEGVADEVMDRPGLWAVKIATYDDLEFCLGQSRWKVNISLEQSGKGKAQWHIKFSEELGHAPKRSWTLQNIVGARNIARLVRSCSQTDEKAQSTSSRS